MHNSHAQQFIKQQTPQIEFKTGQLSLGQGKSSDY